MNHMQSLKFEHKLYTSVKIKMEEMQQHNMSWIEVSRSRCTRRHTPLNDFFSIRFNFSRRPSIFCVSVARH